MATTDSDATVAFLKNFHPDGPWPLTRNCVTGDWSPKMRAVTDVDNYLGECRDNNSLYFNPGIIGKDFDFRRGKPTEADMAGSRAVWAEIDPRDKERIDWDALREECLAPLLRFPITPSILVYSGRGCWAYWLLDQPAARDEVRAINEWLIAELRTITGKKSTVHVDSCANVDRLARLPGGINHRSGRIAEIISYSGLTYSAAEFGRGDSKSNAAAGGEVVISAPIRIDTPDDLDQYVDPRLHEQGRFSRLKLLMFHGHDPENKLKTDTGADASGNGWTWDFSCNATRAGVPNEVILGILLDSRHAISAHCFSQKNPERAAMRAIARPVELGEARPGEWLDESADGEFQCDDKGKPYANQHNIRIALAKLGVKLSYDEFACRLLIGGRHLSDAEVERLWLETESRFKFRPGKDYYWIVVQDAARSNSFHPVLDYLNGLSWDGTPRVEGWLNKYCSAEESDYTRAVGKLFLVAAARRVRQPGCKFDEMMVLESPQGGFKSTALRTLAVNPDWFSDDLPLNADTKRVIESLAGRWIVEAAELKGMRKGEVEHMKAFLSRAVDRARMAYGRIPQEQPRQCVIVGTTNSERYLRDNTGNRRFWPVKVGFVDLPALTADRDQLWAEAAWLESEGESIRLPEKLWAVAHAHQEERRVEDPFVAMLSDKLGKATGKLQAEDAWRIVGVVAGHRTQDHNLRLGEALRELGWTRTKRRFGGDPEWCYVRGDKHEQGQAIQLELDPDDGSLFVSGTVDDGREVPF